METRTRKQEQGRASRERLLDAATRLFAERGYRGASVQAIGDAAGISRGSIFWHFGSKEGLLWAVVQRAFARWEAEALVPDVGSATGVEAMRRALASHRDFLLRDPATLRLLYVLMFEALGPRPELTGHFAELHVHLRSLGAGWLGEGRRGGEIRGDLSPDALAAIVVGALGGLVYQHLLDPTGFDLDRCYGDLERVLARGMAA